MTQKKLPFLKKYPLIPLTCFFLLGWGFLYGITTLKGKTTRPRDAKPLFICKGEKPDWEIDVSHKEILFKMDKKKHRYTHTSVVHKEFPGKYMTVYKAYAKFKKPIEVIIVYDSEDIFQEDVLIKFEGNHYYTDQCGKGMEF